MDDIDALESYYTTFEAIDQTPIDQVLKEMEWEAQIKATCPELSVQDTNDTTCAHIAGHATLTAAISPSTGLASPGSMTAGSTNPSPLVQLLDYDLGFDTSDTMLDPPLIFPDLMANSVETPIEWPAGEWGGGPDFGFDTLTGPPPCPANESSVLDIYEGVPPHKLTWDAVSTENYITDVVPAASAASSSASPETAPPTSILEPTSTPLQQHPCLTCPYCTATFTDKTKLRIHTNKHVKPFRCSATNCGHSTAEKKSLQRHLLARSKWDEEHRLAALDYGLREIKYRCTKLGCTYSTIREDNLKRHITTCL